MEGQGVDLFTHYEWPAYLSSLEPRDPKHDEDVLVAEICANVGGTDDESWMRWQPRLVLFEDADDSDGPSPGR